MDLHLAGWNGPLLVPSTTELDAAYRCQVVSGFPADRLDELKAHLPGCAASRQDYRTRDGHFYFWGLELQVGPGSQVAVLLPSHDEARPVTVYVRGEVATTVIEFIIRALEALFTSWAPKPPPPKVVEIRLRE